MLGSPRSPLSFAPDLFCDGLRRLAHEGHRALGLVEAAALLRAGDGFPDGSLVLTFDDGLASLYEEALPLLVELRWTATVFVTAGSIGGRSVQGWPMLDSGMLHELRGAGISIGCHTVSHPNLARSTDAQVRWELEEGQERLQELLGAPVRSFAYPFGRFDARSRAVAAERFDCACTDVLAYARVGDDPWLLPRIDAWYLSRRWLLEHFGSKSVDAYLTLRRGPRAVRRAVARSPG